MLGVRGLPRAAVVREQLEMRGVNEQTVEFVLDSGSLGMIEGSQSVSGRIKKIDLAADW